MRKTVAYAFHHSIPILIGFFPVGLAYGLLMQQAGYNFLWSGACSLFVLAGSLQFLMVTFFAGGVSLATVAVLALVGVAISVSLKSASSGRLSKSDLILNDTETPPSENADMQLLVGKEGVVKNTLRPVGTAEFDCGKLHVTSDGEYVSEGQRVRIVRVEGTQIFVNKI